MGVRGELTTWRRARGSEVEFERFERLRVAAGSVCRLEGECRKSRSTARKEKIMLARNDGDE